MIQSGANVNAQEEEVTALMIATLQEGSFEIVRLLLENGADTNAQDEEGYGVWCYALGTNDVHFQLEDYLSNISVHDKSDIIRLLINYGLDVDQPDEDGMSILMWAVQFCQIELVKLLLESGADVHMQNEDDETALHIAKSSLRKIQNINEGSGYSETQISNIINNYNDIIKLLKSYGA